MQVSAKQLAAVAWTFARAGRKAPGEAAVLLALLAYGAHGYKPTRAELAEKLAPATKKTAVYDAITALLADRTVIEHAKGRLSLAALAPAETAETDETDTPEDSATSEESGTNPPPDSAAPEAVSAPTESFSAAPEASHAHEEAFKSFEKQKAAAITPRAREIEPLVQFAIEACRLPDAAAAKILQLGQEHGAARVAAALEQFHYAYTTGHGTGKSRLEQLRNPIGQIIAWTRTPEAMDALPASALTVARWQDQRAQAANKQQAESALQQRASNDARHVASFALLPRDRQAAACRALKERAPTLAARFPSHFFDTGPGRDPLALAMPNERAAMLEALAAAAMLAENPQPSRTLQNPQAA